MSQDAETKERPSIDPTTMARHKDVRHMTVEDVGQWKTKPDPHFKKVLDEYFNQFCAPVLDSVWKNGEEQTSQACLACGEKFTGMIANLGIGTMIEWGLVHGEAHCVKCHYPYRGNHTIWDPKDVKEDGTKSPGAEPLMTVTHLFLAYHPEFVGGWKPPKKDPYDL